MDKHFRMPSVEVPEFDFSLVSINDLPEPVQQLVITFIDLAVELSRRPQRHDLEKRGIKPHRIEPLCGSYAELLRLSGYRPILQRRAMKPSSNIITREFIIESFRQFAKEHGATPKRQEIYEMYENGEIPFSVKDINRLFERRYNNAVKAAGLEPSRDRKALHTHASVVKDITDWAAAHGRAPISTEFDRYKDLPSLNVVIGLFDGFDNALAAAGFKRSGSRRT